MPTLTAPKLNLHKHWERVKTEPGLKRNVSAVAGVILLGLIAGSIVLSHQRFNLPWSSHYTLTAEFADTPGIAPGNGQEVRIAGVMVGQISGASVTKDGQAELTLQIDPGHTIYSNARLVLRPKSPLNEMYVNIDPGAPPGTPLPSGSNIPESQTVRPIQVDEVLASLDASTRSALTALLRESDVALAGAPTSLPPGLDALTAVVQQLKPVAVQLNQRRAYLRQLVTSLSEISSAVGGDDKRLNSLIASLDTTLQITAASSPQIQQTLKELPGFTSALSSSTGAVTSLSAQLNPVLKDLANASGDLPAALQKLGTLSQTLSGTLDAAKPALADARPVVADLRPLSANVAAALPMLHYSTARLDPVTSALVPYLPDVAAFFVNTRSITSWKDGSGGILRGLLEITPYTVPNSPLGNLSIPALKGLL